MRARSVMSPKYTVVVICATLIYVCSVSARARQGASCNVPVQTEAGWVCGVTRWAEDGAMYASFRGVPYAKQPLRELRFKELQPLEPWDYLLDASTEGPVCPQTDVWYGRIIQPQSMSESCIHANIHVPVHALPPANRLRLSRELQSPYLAGVNGRDEIPKAGLPILVFIHGGGFSFGSGDADLYGPEYLVSRNVIVITFNYRLNVFGFLSLNSTSIPGNNGLRDMVTLLRWVQRNAQAFGGDPRQVTLAGQSAGSVAAHLLSLSEATKGLFKRVLLMSGNGVSTFYSSSPAYAQLVSKLLLNILAINSTDPEEIHQQLIVTPIEKIVEANSFLLDQFGLTTFVPVVESPHQGVTTILDDDPEVLISKGRGKDYPLITGFTDSECESFRRRFEQFEVVKKVKENLTLMIPVSLVYSTPMETLIRIAKKVDQKYFNGSIDLDGFVKFCTESYYQYPTLSLAQTRAEIGGAPLFMYQFSYEGENSVVKEANSWSYKGAGHGEDLTYIFRVNSMLGTHSSFPPQNKDDSMKSWLTLFVTNFMKCSKPVCGNDSEWPAESPDDVKYQDIRQPHLYHYTTLTEEQREMTAFYDEIQNRNNKLGE